MPQKKFEGSFSYIAPTLLNKVLLNLNLSFNQFKMKIRPIN